jgi:ABC-type lipoprotein export system ATPase subunit
MSEILALHDITKTYFLQSETIEVLRGVDLTVHTGDFVGIFGPSGSGKSTLLNIMGSLDRATDGIVLFDTMNLAEHDDAVLSEIRNKRIGFVFQFHHLLDEFS